MNYRHGFHAGNFADVFKHALLTRIFVHLLRKDAPFRVVDTHAGEGEYDLASEEAERTGEWRGGVGRLEALDAPPEIAALLEPYLSRLGPFRGGRPTLYPGSPRLAQSFLRQDDRAIFCELRDDGFEKLRARFSRDLRIKTLHLDGYTGAGAFLPPKERRGLVLIDPPFERSDEFSAMFSAFQSAHRKWPTGIYALWHPVRDPAGARAFYEAFRKADIRRVLRLELCVGGPGERLNRTGLAVINPPYTLAEEARALLPFLAERLAQGQGAGWEMEVVTGE